VLADGSRVTWGDGTASAGGDLARQCEAALRSVRSAYCDEIEQRYPKVLRRNGGYGLDRLLCEGDVRPESIVCGSEGTLGIVVGATLRLTPLPAHRGLVLAHFDDLLDSLRAVPRVLAHGPAAVELIDKLVFDAARSQPAMARRSRVIEGDPAGVLVIELYADDVGTLRDRLDAVADDLRANEAGYAWPVVTDAATQKDVWDIRKSGLGLLMSRPGDEQPYAFVEDTAVDPARLRDYIARFRDLLAEERVNQAGYYAHASVGCLHVRPVLNLRKSSDVERMRRIAERVSGLVLEFGGTMTGEHGDGIVRSEWLEKMYGARIVAAFRAVKDAFDPQRILNPGKIVDPMPMTAHLRYAYVRRDEPVGEETGLDFGAHGGMAGLAGMCSGVGQCRQRLVGTMCPSYMATGDETHTTRARANALRLALSDHTLLRGLDDPALDDVMDLCLSCKACRTECPTGVDMARLKSEWLWQRSRRRGAPWRDRLIAGIADAAAWASRMPALANAVLQSPVARRLMDGMARIDHRVPPPRFARQTFRDWFARRRATDAASARHGAVVLFVDTWMNYFTPDVGRSAVRVLEALGYAVIVPPTMCCGRPAISKGLLDRAKGLAVANVEVLASYAERGLPIVGVEPSCILTFIDEVPQLVRTAAARRIAGAVQMIESLLARRLESDPTALQRATSIGAIRYHGHCHQKALVGTDDAMTVLRALAGEAASEINSGCCGMAGSFGHEKGHYEVARAVGEQRLFPAVRDRGAAAMAVSGFSCRHQIAHHTGAEPRHVVELLADALDPFAGDPEVSRRPR